VKRAFVGLMLALVAALGVSRAAAQASPEDTSREWQIWTGGGHGINGSQEGTGVWNVGFRYGMILTSPTGICGRCGTGVGDHTENEYGVWGEHRPVRIQMDFRHTEEGKAVFSD
jgi:hypothetical protein